MSNKILLLSLLVLISVPTIVFGKHNISYINCNKYLIKPTYVDPSTNKNIEVDNSVKVLSLKSIIKWVKTVHNAGGHSYYYFKDPYTMHVVLYTQPSGVGDYESYFTFDLIDIKKEYPNSSIIIYVNARKLGHEGLYLKIYGSGTTKWRGIWLSPFQMCVDMNKGIFSTTKYYMWYEGPTEGWKYLYSVNEPFTYNTELYLRSDKSVGTSVETAIFDITIKVYVIQNFDNIL